MNFSDLRRPNRQAAIAAAVCSVSLLLPNMLVAQELYFESEIEETLSYTDNISFEAENEEVSATGLLSRVEGKWGLRSELTDSSFTARFNLDRYNIRRFNSDGYLIGLESTTTKERVQRTLQLDIARESTLSTEFEDSGELTVPVDRHSIVAGGALTRSLNNRNEINLGYTFTDSSFDVGESEATFFDSQTHDATFEFRHERDQRNEFFSSVNYLNLKSPDNANTVDESFSLEVGWTRRFTEQFLLTGSVGRRRTSSAFDMSLEPGDESASLSRVNMDNNDSDFSLLAEWSLLVSTFSIEASRNVGASSRGELSQSDEVAFGWRRDLSDRFQTGLALRFLQTSFDGASVMSIGEPDAAASVSDSRDSYLFEPYLTWQSSERAMLELRYQYRESKGDDADSSATDSMSGTPSDTRTSNAVLITFSYSWL